MCTVTLGQGHGTTLGHGQQLFEISRSNLAASSGPDTDLGDVCNVTLALEIGPLVKVNNKCVKYYPDPNLQGWVMARTRIFSICDLDRGDITLGQGMTHPWVMNNNCVNIIQIQLGSGVMSRTRILGTCVLLP